MLVQRDQRAQALGVEPVEPEDVAGDVAGELAVRRQGVRGLGVGAVLQQLRLGFLQGAAQGHGLGLGAQVQVHHGVVRAGQRQGRVLALHADEIDRQRMAPLVHELEVGVLAVDAQAAPDDGAGVHRRVGAVQVRALAVGLHVHLLHEGHEAHQARGVAHDELRGHAQEVAVPHAVQRQAHGQVVMQWRVQKVLVHGAATREQSPEGRRADADGQRQAERGPQRVAPAHPIPEQEGALRVVAELGRLGRRGGDGHQVPGDGVGRHAVVGQPVARAGGVGERLLRGEGLAGDDEQGALGVESAQHAPQGPGVGVGDVVHAHRVAGQVGERVGRHARAQVGAADADVHHVGEGVVGVAAHAAGAHLLGEAADAVELALHLGVDRVAPGATRLAAAQRHVQHGAVFGGVDGVAAEHGFPALGDAALRGEFKQGLFDGGGQALAARVQREARHGPAHAFGAAGLGEQVAQVRLGLGGESLEAVPGGQVGGLGHGVGRFSVG